MKVYKITDAYIRNNHVDIRRLFSSRNDAINYMFDYYNNHYVYNVELVDEYPQKDKHDIHYVLDQYDSFNVIRTEI